MVNSFKYFFIYAAVVIFTVLRKTKKRGKVIDTYLGKQKGKIDEIKFVY